MHPESVTGKKWRGALAVVAGGVAAIGAGTLAIATAWGSLGGAILFLICGALLVAASVDRAAKVPRAQLRELRAALASLSRGEVTRRLVPGRLGDLAAGAAALNSLAEAAGIALRRMNNLAANLQRLPDEITEALGEIEAGTGNQEAAVEETASLLANMNTSIRGINEEIDALARHNEETASSITQMSSAVEEVATSASELQRSVESSTSAVHEMGAQIGRVAESSDTVQHVAEETASAIVEMDRTIQQVGDHVRGASELTQKVSDSAEEGAKAVGATIDGIAEIRDLTLGARSALEELDRRIEEIGQIATVIGGISDETNLLSLNAAIIAAQAGEHGKAFAVVAEQVKTLARRTTTSTKQIEALIEAVQNESKNAVRAMGTGIESVENGVERSRVAGKALEAIIISSRDASGRVAEIARATEEQARNSKHVADSARQTSEHVQQISAAMNEQSEASGQLLKNSTNAVEMCHQMTRATEEQRETGRYISSNIASITEMIRSIQERTAIHGKASSAVSGSVSSILDNARKSSERIPTVTRIVDELRRQATEVAAEIRRFEEAAHAPDDRA